jgi:hypothetical protein
MILMPAPKQLMSVSSDLSRAWGSASSFSYRSSRRRRRQSRPQHWRRRRERTSARVCVQVGKGNRLELDWRAQGIRIHAEQPRRAVGEWDQTRALTVGFRVCEAAHDVSRWQAFEHDGKLLPHAHPRAPPAVALPLHRAPTWLTVESYELQSRSGGGSGHRIAHTQQENSQPRRSLH